MDWASLPDLLLRPVFDEPERDESGLLEQPGLEMVKHQRHHDAIKRSARRPSKWLAEIVDAELRPAAAAVTCALYAAANES